MKTFRLTDLVLQVILLLMAVALGIREMAGQSGIFFYFYFIVGFWQISSMLVHYFLIRPTIFHHQRTAYARLTLIILITGFICGLLFYLFPGSVFLLALYLYGLLWLSPVLAIFYLYICWREYGLIIKRELIHLK